MVALLTAEKVNYTPNKKIEQKQDKAGGGWQYAHLEWREQESSIACAHCWCY
jgi:hypothetical protein